MCLMCLRTLRAFPFLRALRAFIFLHALHALIFLRALRALIFLCAFVPSLFCVPSFFTCLTCLHFLRAYILFMYMLQIKNSHKLMKIYPRLSSIFTSVKLLSHWAWAFCFLRWKMLITFKLGTHWGFKWLLPVLFELKPYEYIRDFNQKIKISLKIQKMLKYHVKKFWY